MGAMLTAGLLGTVAPVMGQGASFPVEIHEGVCDDPGSAVSMLTDVPRQSAATIGAADAIPASSSFTSVPLSLDAITGSDHVVLVPAGNGDTVLACGAIGGVRQAEGALIIGLEAEGRGGLTGIVYFSPSADPTVTDVSVFLAGRSLAETRANGIEQQPAVAQQAPTAVPTAVPAAAAQQGLTDQEQAYVDDVMPIISDMTDSLGRAGELFTNPRIGEDDWSLNVAVELGIWRASYQRLDAITPPPAFQTMHGHLLDALRQYNDASFDIANGLDSFDLALIEAGADKMIAGSASLDLATAELNRIRDERGI
ncbi:MAG: hypothetical protein QM692_06830 [Thermomicrobiales bacterium]